MDTETLLADIKKKIDILFLKELLVVKEFVLGKEKELINLGENVV